MAVAAAQAGELGKFELSFAEGVWAFHLGQDQIAVDQFKEALDVKAGDPRARAFARYWLGLAYLRVGRGEDALAELEASRASDPLPPVPPQRQLADHGAAELAAGNAEAAAKNLGLALADGGEGIGALYRAATFYRYADALARLGREAEGEAARAQARALAPELDPEDLPVTPPEVDPAFTAAGPWRRWDASLELTATEDSNPNLLSEELRLPSPDSEVLDPEFIEGAETDSRAGFDLHAAFQPLLGRTGDDWSLAFGLDGGHSFHERFDYLDLGRLRAAVQAARGGDPRRFLVGPLGAVAVPAASHRPSLLFQGSVEELWLGGAPYLLLVEGAAAMVLRAGTASDTRLDLHLRALRYAGHELADDRRDGEEATLGVKQLFFLGGRRDRHLGIGLRAGQRWADPEFERRLFEAQAEAVLPLTERWRLQLTASLTDEDFDDPASDLFAPEAGPREPREDRTWRARGVLVFEATKQLQLTLRAEWAERDSSTDLGTGLPDLDYRRSVVTAGLLWRFGG